MGVRWYSADPCTILYNPRQWEYGGIQWEYGGIQGWEYGGIQWEYGGIPAAVQDCTGLYRVIVVRRESLNSK